MYSKWQLARKYLNYYFSASSRDGHGVHSPFVFDFIQKVLTDKHLYPAYKRVEALRSKLKDDTRMITVQDYGAGSVIDKKDQRSLASIAKNAVKPKKFGQLLFRMARHYQPAVILELGTSLGITTSYLSLARPTARIITLEGARSIAEVARNNFEKVLPLKNISVVEGNFENTLAAVLENEKEVDMAFIDGNHRREPTERYFQQLLAKTHNESILLFDDIHWSREMEEAWETIKSHPSVRGSIDLFFTGIILFRKEFKEKRHFVIRF